MDQTLSDLYKIISTQVNISEGHAEYIIKYVFHDIRRQISNPKGVDILIHNFANFEIPETRVQKVKEIIMKSYAKGNMSESVMKKAIKKLEIKNGKQ